MPCRSWWTSTHLQGGWAVLVFHDIDGSRLTVGRYDFDMLLDYLKRKAGEIWTAPMAEVAARIAVTRSAR